MPEDEDGLKDAGDFLFEVVDARPEDVDGLTEWITPAFEDAFEVAEYLTMGHPASSFSTFRVLEGGRFDDSLTAHYRAISWAELVGGRKLGSERSPSRGERLVDIRATRPEGEDEHEAIARRLPGRVGNDLATQARLRGDPEWLIDFEHGIGRGGPSRVPQRSGHPSWNGDLTRCALRAVARIS